MTKETQFQTCLEDMKQIFDKHNHHFFLAWGTLLGCYREHKFISYDGDIDIGVLEETFDSSIINKIIKSPNFNLYREYGNYEKRNIQYTFKHMNGVKIDIFVFYKIKDDYYYTSTFNGLCSNKKEGFCKWGRHIRGFIEEEFYGKPYNIPLNTEEHLIESYGNDYMKPKRFNYFQGLNGQYKNLIN